jgi:hypothetical protein
MQYHYRFDLIHIGEMLDFDKRFCEATINELLSNPHISGSPIDFHDDTVTNCFFRDAVRLANGDGCIHSLELRRLQQTAHANGRSDEWLSKIIQEYQSDPSVPIEIIKHIWMGQPCIPIK